MKKQKAFNSLESFDKTLTSFMNVSFWIATQNIIDEKNNIYSQKMRKLFIK